MIQWFNKKLKNRKGFTLIELIVVIAILGILALIAIPRFGGIQASANVSAVKSTLRNIDTAISVVAAEKNIDIDDVDADDVGVVLGWDTGTAGAIVYPTESPKGITYTITAAGVAQASAAATEPAKWPSDAPTLPVVLADFDE